MTSDPVVPNLGASHGPATILVVEDDIITRMAVCEDLRDQGYGVIEAGTADEALSILRTGVPIELVLTDLKMPGSLDGNGLVRLIKTEFTWLKIVMLSGHLPEADVRMLLDGYVSKPALPSQLVRYVRTLISPRARVEVS
jgi:CheY-like chemotaxis protein